MIFTNKLGNLNEFLFDNCEINHGEKRRNLLTLELKYLIVQEEASKPESLLESLLDSNLRKKISQKILFVTRQKDLLKKNVTKTRNSNHFHSESSTGISRIQWGLN